MFRVSFKALAFSLIAAPLWADDLPLYEPEFTNHSSATIELGQLLFYDPILSGSKTVSCATCHHPKFATGDGVSLGIGDGGVGLGPNRTTVADNTPEQRIPRNAPALFNLGAKGFSVFFHDGRLEIDVLRPSGIRTPLGSEMEAGFASALSAQSMFPRALAGRDGRALHGKRCGPRRKARPADGRGRCMGHPRQTD